MAQSTERRIVRHGARVNGKSLLTFQERVFQNQRDHRERDIGWWVLGVRHHKEIVIQASGSADDTAETLRRLREKR